MEKGIVFILILGLAGCYGRPEQDVGAGQKISTPAPVLDNKAPGQQIPTVVNPTPAENKTAAGIPANATSTQNTTITAANETTSNETKTPVPTEANSTVTEKATSLAPKDDKTSTANETSTPKANNGTAPHEDKSVTTPKNEVAPKSTEVPPSHDAEKPTVQARAFDGPSFIGGIILTLGILAIGFMGFKYYRNQTERNYHTL